MSRYSLGFNHFAKCMSSKLARARCGDPYAIKEIGELGNYKDERSRGALHFAALYGLTDVCKYLLEKLKLDVNECDAFGRSPLSHAANQRHGTTAKYLVDHGASFHIDGVGALHCAAQNGEIELMKVFLAAKGVSVDMRDGSRRTPLVLAAFGGHQDAIKFLLECHANPNGQPGDDIHPIVGAIASQSVECLKLLIKAGADVNLDMNCYGRKVNPLHFAANNRDEKIIKCLLEAQANPDATSDLLFADDSDWFSRRPRKPIEVAASRGRMEAVQILFPVTKRIDDIPEWSVDGIIRHVNEF